MHILGTEVVESLGRVGAQILLEDHKRGNRTAHGKLVVRHSLIGVDEGHHAGAFLRDAPHLRKEIGIGSRGLVNDELGGAEDPGFVPAPPRTPLAGRGEGDGPLNPIRRAGALRFAQVLPNGFRCRVGTVARGARQCAKHHDFVTGNDLDAPHANAAGGERARLVEAQAVHAREDLNGGKFLDEYTAACQRCRSDREVHRRQEHQALRDHADHRGYREHEGLAPVSPVTAGDAILRVEGQHDDGKQHDGDDLQHPVDRRLDLRDRTCEGTRLLGQALRVDALAHSGGHHAASTRNDARAGQQLISLLLLHRARLAGQQRLIDFEARRGQDRTVHAHLIAERQIDDVVEHNVTCGNNRQGAVAQDGRLRSIDDRERVEGSLGTQLRNDADHRVDDHDATENAITQVTEQQHDDRRSDDNPVEQRQDVLADDRRHRPRRTILHPVDRAARDALGNLGGGQTMFINRQAVSAHRHPPRPSRCAPATQSR